GASSRSSRRSTHAGATRRGRRRGIRRRRRSGRSSASRLSRMPDALWFTDDPKACELLAKDPFALLVGFAIDQQVTVMKAFAGPQVLKERAGTLDPKKLAKMDLAPLFAEKPAIHRFPGAMAERVRDLAAVVADEYGGDAPRLW